MATLSISSTAVTVDLLAGPYQVRAGTWVLRGPSMTGDTKSSPYAATWAFKQFEPITETFDLIGRGDDLRETLTDLDALLEQARRWHSDPLDNDTVYLNMKGTWETAGRRALVLNGMLTVGSTPATSPLLDGVAALAQLTLTRSPLWEYVASIYWDGTDTTGDLSALGGAELLSLSPNPFGSAPGRIASATLAAGDAGYVLTTFWVGLRSPGAGTTGFLGLWECENGTVGTDASLWKDAGEDASPSDVPTHNKVKVGYAGFGGSTPALSKRLSITVGDVIAGDWQHMIGRYVVLLRCKTNAGAAGVQLRWGVNSAADDTFAKNETAYLDNTVWRLINLGEVQIPPVGVRYGTAYIDLSIEFTELQIWAEQVAADSLVLDLDCLILIPADHYAAGSGMTLEQDTSTSGYIYTTENDMQAGVAESNTNSAKRVISDLTLRDWCYPVDGALAVVAAERAAGSVLGDTVQLTLSAIPRWRSYHA